MVSKHYSTNLTLAHGIRTIPVTVTTTRTSLGSLLDTAESGRLRMPGCKSLTLLNTDASVTIYVLESTTQTITNGWPIPAGGTLTFEASESFGDLVNEGLYFAVSSGTATMKVLEAR